MSGVSLRTVLRCPHCGFKTVELMPRHERIVTLICAACQERLDSREGKCCVYCSWGRTPCPTAQGRANG